MGPAAEISLALQIIPGINGGSVMIPGCEPISLISGSVTLAKEFAKVGCDKPLVYVNDILREIPGTKVVAITNIGVQTGQRLLLFPPYKTGCYCASCLKGTPCGSPLDYYGILKTLGRPVEEEQPEPYNDCDPDPIFSMDRGLF